MKTFMLILAIFLLTSNIIAYSQEVDSTISIVNKKKYYLNDQKLTGKELGAILSNNAASATAYKKANKNMLISSGLLLTGSTIILVATVIDLSASIKESNDLNNGTYTGDYKGAGLGVYLGGLAFVVAAVPVTISGRKSLHKSINQYNSSLVQSKNRPLELELKVYGNGLGLRMTF